MDKHKEEEPIPSENFKKAILVLAGSILAAAGLQYFLIPNQLLDGGITGLSIIAAHLSSLPVGVFLIVLNIPFVWLGYRKFGKDFAALSTLGILLLATLTILFHTSTGFTGEPILAAVFGGILVGVGVGLVIRYGGTLDGGDTVAILIDRVTIFSIGEAIMIMNLFIIGGAGFVFGWDRAMFSLIAYFVAHKAIDVTVEGLNEDRSVWIVSKHAREIGAIITEVTGEPITYIKEGDSKNKEPHGVLLAVITRFEEQKVKSAVQAIDPRAFIVISNAHEVVGKDLATK